MSLSRRYMLALGAIGLTSAIALESQTNAKTVKSPEKKPMNTSSESLTDYAAIINAVNGIAIYADLRDWNRCRQSFTDRVEFDYTSLTGGKPTTIAADQQMQQWSDFFKSTFKSTQHIVGSHVVIINGYTATCLSNFQAHHTYLDSKKGTWILSGVYNHDLVRVGDQWKVSKMKMAWTWENGTRPF
jgi:carboxypeptidase C (cathepsin A)